MNEQLNELESRTNPNEEEEENEAHEMEMIAELTHIYEEKVEIMLNTLLPLAQIVREKYL